jgi:hypothetical protein
MKEWRKKSLVYFSFFFHFFKNILQSNDTLIADGYWQNAQDINISDFT